MASQLLRAPFPPGYGDALLPVAQCKSHLVVDGADDDALIQAFRDAAIETIERHVATSLGPVSGHLLACDSLPSLLTATINPMLRPVTAITSITWLDSAGQSVSGTAADYRVGAEGAFRLRPGATWPLGVSGGVMITFDAGYPAGKAPPALLHAARLMLGHLWRHRDEALDADIAESLGALPSGVRSLCRSFRRATV